MSSWCSRPVFFVESIKRSVAFYTDKLGFTSGDGYAETERLLVTQVSREGCHFCSTVSAGGEWMFVSLNLASLQTLRLEVERRRAPVHDDGWGYDTIMVEDPNGNELFFPYSQCKDAAAGFAD